MCTVGQLFALVNMCLDIFGTQVHFSKFARCPPFATLLCFLRVSLVSSPKLFSLSEQNLFQAKLTTKCEAFDARSYFEILLFAFYHLFWFKSNIRKLSELASVNQGY